MLYGVRLRSWISFGVENTEGLEVDFSLTFEIGLGGRYGTAPGDARRRPLGGWWSEGGLARGEKLKTHQGELEYSILIQHASAPMGGGRFVSRMEDHRHHHHHLSNYLERGTAEH